MVKRLQRVETASDVRDRVQSLPRRFRKVAAAGITAEWQLEVGGQTFTISIVEGNCFVRDGPSLAPSIRVAMDIATWVAIDDGALVGSDALVAGKLSVRGNLDLAVRLQSLFEPYARPRGPADIEQVQIKANGVTLSSYLFGPEDAPAVVFLHGLGASKISWLPSLPPLAERYRLIVPDLPGHGESDKPRTDYTPRYYARIVRRLLESVGAESVVIVGNSMGGRIALEVAVRSPDRVAGLALLGPAVPGFRVRYVLGFSRVIPTELGAIPFPMRERWMGLVLRRLFANPEAISEEARLAAADEFIRIYATPAARMAFFDSMRHIVMEQPKPFWDRVNRIRVPALVIWGEQDRLVPVRHAAKLSDALRQSELVVMPNVGHVPQFEAVRDTNRLLARFLKRTFAGIKAV